MVYSEQGSGPAQAHRGGMEQFDRQKFKAMVHYAIHRCPPDRLGRTKLNKVAFYADMMAYLQTGRPMTRETYVKQDHGPVARHMTSCLEELIRSGAVQSRLVDYYGFAKYEYSAPLPPDGGRLSSSEAKIVDEMIEFVCIQNSARSISELSHTEAWHAAKSGEELPYFAATELLDGAEVDEADLAWADQEIERLADQRPEYHPLRGLSLRALSQQLRSAPRGS